MTVHAQFAIIGTRIQEATMKTIATLFGVFAVLTLAAVGCLYIFGVRDFEQSTSFLLKAVGALALLGGCTALISLLMSNKQNGDTD